MDFLADENIENALICWLRNKGHDVLWAAENLSSLSDRELVSIANRSNRIILTRDLDFGELVYREKLSSQGIILLRIQARNPYERLQILQGCWEKVVDHGRNHFIVVTNSLVRIRPLETP